MSLRAWAKEQGLEEYADRLLADAGPIPHDVLVLVKSLGYPSRAAGSPTRKDGDGTSDAGTKPAAPFAGEAA